jgi:hypothetical protein
MRGMADTSCYTWIGYFAAANMWRDRVKNFKRSRGLTGPSARPAWANFAQESGQDQFRRLPRMAVLAYSRR